MIRLDIGSATLVGQVRAANEDAVLVTDGLTAVADGMGGHNAGEVASADTVAALAEVAGGRSLDDLVRGVHLANRRISEQAEADPDLRGMGTTVCVVGLVSRDGADEVAVLNVGDSRVYLLADGVMQQLTEDHSLVEALVREGRLSPEEANTHPQKNVLTRALGVEPLVVVDAWLLRPCDGDRLLLCSDGLTNELDDERIAELLGEAETPDVIARRLAAEADAAGGRDNTTTVVVDVVDAGSDPAPMGDRFRRITTPAVDLSDDDGHGPDTETVMAVIATAGVYPGPPAADTPDAPEGDDGAGPAAPEEGDGTAEDGDSDIAALARGDDDGPEDPGDNANEDQLAAAQAEAEAAVARAARWRTAAFVFAIVGVIGLAVVAIALTAGRGWYVTENDNGHVALYSGTPVLWIEPDEVEQADQVVEDLTPADQSTVRQGSSFSDEDAARDLIENLVTTTTTTSTTTTTTTTTAVPTTTVAPPAPSAPGP